MNIYIHMNSRCLNYFLDWTFMTFYNRYICIYLAKQHHTCMAPTIVQVTYKVLLNSWIDMYYFVPHLNKC